MFEFFVISWMASALVVAVLLAIMIVFAAKNKAIRGLVFASAGCIALCVALFFVTDHFYARPAAGAATMEPGFPTWQGDMSVSMPPIGAEREPVQYEHVDFF